MMKTEQHQPLVMVQKYFSIFLSLC